ncbi:abhydrolase domain-containing protein, partial [Trifolium medium]|nr:abhydrolase domain-containing protein [Trifolium medium]
MDLNCLQAAPKTFIPALFGHGNDDEFVQPHHSDLIFESYAGDKNIIKFDGDHNSTRPRIFFDSVCIFFYDVLRPPRIPRGRRFEKYYSLRDTKIGSVVNEGLLYDLISNMRTATIDAASSSSALPTIASESMIRNMTYGYGEPADSK